MIKSLLPVLLLFSAWGNAQTRVDKTFSLGNARQLQLHFEDPKLIRIQTWDRQDVGIKGVVNINNGEHDSAFEITSRIEGDALRIQSTLKDRESIPKRLMIKRGDQEYYFKTGDVSDPEVQKFLSENGHEYRYMSNGILQDITLEVFVPQKVSCELFAKFGIVEIVNYNGPLTVNAHFGGIDATIPAAKVGEITARTKFGEILTNLDVKFDQKRFAATDESWTEIHAKPGTGPAYMLESKFGKLYLRKP